MLAHTVLVLALGAILLGAAPLEGTIEGDTVTISGNCFHRKLVRG